jgi:hypothetical protein
VKGDPFHYVLGIHIFAGTVALIIAPLAMLTVKGGLWHRRWGKIYFQAMAGVALTAAVLCWLRSGLFLFLIALFSFYLALTGYRVLGRKNPGAKPAPFDISIAVVMVLTSSGLILLGALGDDQSQRWVRIIFGILGLRLGLLDIFRLFKPPQDRQAWLLSHMTRFLSAYIATVTAFSVVNFQFLPYFWRWLWPTMFGVLGIIAWRRHYIKKFKTEAHGIVL